MPEREKTESTVRKKRKAPKCTLQKGGLKEPTTKQNPHTKKNPPATKAEKSAAQLTLNSIPAYTFWVKEKNSVSRSKGRELQGKPFQKTGSAG